MTGRARSFGVALLFVALTVAMTWPQARHMGTQVYDADDPLLSIWRISWIAHILPVNPTQIFNGNIFYPEPRTLAYTDSVLLQGLAGAPLIWAGVSNVVVYNLLLLGSMALSGWAMWRYALHLTGNGGGAIIAGVIFAFVPYRFDHYHHLELQATFFLPLTLLYLDRALESGSKRDAWLTMICLAGQVYTCIYYSVFLVTAAVPVALYRLIRSTADTRKRFFLAIAPAAFAAAVIVAPYALAYVLNRETLGERLDRDVRLYSATFENYFATSEFNTLYGWTRQFGQPERLLFPGAIALILAGIGLSRFDRQRITLAIVGVTGFIISLGLNSIFYEPLRAVVLAYRGLRAPARASILFFLAISALAAFGFARLMRGRSPKTMVVATVLVSAALLGEYRTAMVSWLLIPNPPAAVYQWLKIQPRSVVIEVPFARAERLHAIADGLYMFNSTRHWQPIVNGYSGFFPKSFYQLSAYMAAFPDENSIGYLKRRGVDLIIVHGALLGPDEFGATTAALLARPDIEAVAQFEEPMGLDAVFRLRR